MNLKMKLYIYSLENILIKINICPILVLYSDLKWMGKKPRIHTTENNLQKVTKEGREIIYSLIFLKKSPFTRNNFSFSFSTIFLEK